MPLVNDPSTPGELADIGPFHVNEAPDNPPPSPRRQRASRANGASPSTKGGPKSPKARTAAKGAKGKAVPRTPRTPPPDLDTRIRVFSEAEGRCCVTGRLLNPLAYGRDWDVVDGELVSTAALKVKGQGRGARSWDGLREVLRARLDAARALEREFGHLYPAGSTAVTLFMGGAAPPADQPIEREET